MARGEVDDDDRETVRLRERDGERWDFREPFYHGDWTHWKDWRVRVRKGI